MDRRIAKNYIYNIIYQMLIVIVPLLVTPYLARTLGADRLGIYDYCYSQCSLIITFSLIGIGNYGNREIAYTKSKYDLMSVRFKEILFTQFCLGIISILVFIIVFFINPYQKYYILFILWVIANIVDCSWLFLGVEDMKYAVIKNIIAKILFVVSIFIFVHSSNDLPIYILTFGGTMLFANLLCYKDVKKFVSLHGSIKKINIMQHISASFNLFLPTVVTQVLLSIDKLILGLFGEQISLVSFYSNSEKIIQIPLTLVTVLNVVMMPRLANLYKNSEKSELNNYVKYALKFSLLISLPIMFGILAICDNLIPWFLGDEFLPCINAIKILSPIVLICSLTGVSGNQYFVATNQVRILFVANLISAIVNVFLDILLVKKFGLIGVCSATVIAQMISFVIQYFIFGKQINLIEIFKSCKKYIYGSIVMYFSIFRIMPMQTGSITKSVIQIFIGVVVYFGFLILTKDDLIVSVLKKFKVSSK